MGVFLVEIVAASVVVAALLMIPLAVSAVRRKSRQQSGLFPNPTHAEILHSEPIDNSWQYVATTFSDGLNSRVWAYGMWQRGWCRPAIEGASINIYRKGADTIVIPIESLSQVVLGSSTIGRGVEIGGLMGIQWESGGHTLTTWLRANAPRVQSELKNALERELV
jgi:hypothetical protein